MRSLTRMSSQTAHSKADENRRRVGRSEAVPNTFDFVELHLRLSTRTGESVPLAKLKKDDFVCVLDKTKKHKHGSLKFGDCVTNWAAQGVRIYQILGFHAIKNTMVDGYVADSDHARALVVPFLPTGNHEWKIGGVDDQEDVTINYFIAFAKVNVVPSVREGARVVVKKLSSNGVHDDDENNNNDNNVSTTSSTPRKRSSVAVAAPVNGKLPRHADEPAMSPLARLRLAQAKKARAEAEEAEVAAAIRVELAASQELHNEEQALDAEVERLRSRRVAVQVEIAKREKYCEEQRRTLQGINITDLLDLTN